MNAACLSLLRLAQRENIGRIELTVRADGRVEIRGVNVMRITKWRVDADLEDGGVLDSPEKAMEKHG